VGKITIEYSNLPKDARVIIPGINGDFQNGKTYDIPDLKEDLYFPPREKKEVVEPKFKDKEGGKE
jgi:hypothetical protein